MVRKPYLNMNRNFPSLSWMWKNNPSKSQHNVNHINIYHSIFIEEWISYILFHAFALSYNSSFTFRNGNTKPIFGYKIFLFCGLSTSCSVKWKCDWNKVIGGKNFKKRKKKKRITLLLLLLLLLWYHSIRNKTQGKNRWVLTEIKKY